MCATGPKAGRIFQTTGPGRVLHINEPRPRKAPVKPEAPPDNPRLRISLSPQAARNLQTTTIPIQVTAYAEITEIEMPNEKFIPRNSKMKIFPHARGLYPSR
jgi:hypothetical protein